MPGVKNILPTSVQHAGDAAPGPADGQHTIATKNRWSRVVLKFRDLAPDVWCEFSFRISWESDEEARNVQDFAAIGFSFHADDGSLIDFASVPGLHRAQIDPYCDFVPGPAYHDRHSELTHTGHARVGFFVPAPATSLTITIRSWRNSHPFRVERLSLRQFVQGRAAAETTQEPRPSQEELHASIPVPRRWRALRTDPQWLGYGVVPGHRLFIRGQVIAKGAERDGALARIVYRDALGNAIAPPYAETLATPAIGAFVNIPTNLQANRFTLELLPPHEAAFVEIGFQAWRDDVDMELVLPLEASLEDCLLLESISTEESAGATRFLHDLVERLALTPMRDGKLVQADLLDTLLGSEPLGTAFTIQKKLRSIQLGERQEFSSGHISLATFPAWQLPNDLTWTEDPFRSPAWRLDFQSLSWLLDLPHDTPASIDHAISIALSWLNENPWGSPKDGLSSHPLALARRAEVFLELLALETPSKNKDLRALITLLGETIRHGFALAEIVGQNVFPLSIHQIHAAAALLAIAQALPRLPLSRYWSSLALEHLREGYGALIAPDGTIAEPSQHYRLELISLGLILNSILEPLPEAASFRQELLPRLQGPARSCIALTDPSGALPAFGDAPHGYAHAPWMRRLLARYGQPWISDDAIRSELSYPEGARTLVFEKSGIAAARYFEQGRPWAHLSASFAMQRQMHGHFDCTSFNYAAGGVRWITDAGGAADAEAGPPRQYLISPRAHSVAMPDGREPTSGTAWLRAATSLAGVTILDIVSNVHGPDYAHRRIFVFLNNLSAIAVFDHFAGSGASLIFEGLLHLEPEVTAFIAGPQLAVGVRDKRKLRIVPHAIQGRFGGFEIAQGRNERPSSVQGFVSRRPGTLEPANTIRYAFAGPKSVCGGVLLSLDDSSLKRLKAIVESAELKDILVASFSS
ncbi:heparinase II/III domain-containing protein [Microvirga flavescens]|uniref:heparinase II/III domain-containing protein n=1 Tax=Microvirga flavescens TaxID=2249811 RepID=UPI000DD83CBA|nr:heparinase II/III family protein [Microvirga flavescens]